MFAPVTSVRSLSLAQTNKPIVFISDVHLGLGSAQVDALREQRLVALLKYCVSNAAHVFIVGDLFDFWFDWATVIPRGHVRTLAALADLVEGGVGVTYLIGNHDFGHHRYFREQLGIEIDTGDVDLTIGSTRVYVSHGDGKARKDTGYLVLRSILRSPLSQWLYRCLHPNVAIALAARTSKGSRDYTKVKDYGDGDGLRDFAVERINEGYHYVIMGHRHQAKIENHGAGAYVNIGHWLEGEPTYVEFTPEEGMIHRVVP